jgi:phytanoyl-CoA hydroxylase
LSALESQRAVPGHGETVAGSPNPPGSPAAPSGQWLDQVYLAIDAYVAGLGPDATKHGRDLRTDLQTWMCDGMVAFPGLIGAELSDAYLADLEDLWNGRVGAAVTFRRRGGEGSHWEQLSNDALAAPGLEAVDFHNQSMAGKRVVCQPAVVELLGHVFKEQMVLVQTFSQLRGGDQFTHDEAARCRMVSGQAVAGVFVALEDTRIEAGPMGVFPGSHALNLTPPSASENDEERHLRLEDRCAGAGLHRRLLLLDRGDVVLWHGRLAHAGTAPVGGEASRLSMLGQFAPLSAYRFDHRAPESTPKRQLVNGALVYGDPRYPELENSLGRTVR